MFCYQLVRTANQLVVPCIYVNVPVASGILTGVMGNRFYQTRSLMPAGMVAGVRYGQVAACLLLPVTDLGCFCSLLMLLRYGQQYLKK